ncbi:MAG: hypothetical protein ACI8QS_000235 [Planctomycetota bacterium]
MAHTQDSSNPTEDSNTPRPVQSGRGVELGCAESKADIDDGVDVTLVRWMLSLSPAERLATLQRNVNAVARIRAFNESR